MKSPSLKILSRSTYVPVLSMLERRAYEAAHRIISSDVEPRHLACPGAKRSRRVDRIAEILIETFEERK